MRELRIALEPIASTKNARIPRSWVCSKETVVARIAGFELQIAGERKSGRRDSEFASDTFASFSIPVLYLSTLRNVKRSWGLG
jgi:hypothetical protein